MKNTSIYFLLLLVTQTFSNQILQAQSIVSTEIMDEMSADDLTNQVGFPAMNGVVAYKVLYVTTGTDLLPDTASGVVVIPDEVTENGIIAYQHGTTSGPTDVPSNRSSEYTLALALGGQGYIVSVADYLGLGESRGFHPYVHAATEASAGIDLLIGARDLAHQSGFESIPNIFVSGYSQGGHGAMAMAQALQERMTDDLWVTAVSAMSGPYSLSGTMSDLVFESEENYHYPSYLAYIVMGYQEAYGDIYGNLSDVFRDVFIEDLEMFYRGEINLNDLNGRMITTSLLEYQSLKPYNLLQVEFLEAVQSDSLHPMNVALRDNDTYQWIPEFPMRIFYCSGDDQVPYRNSVVADSFMNASGAEDVMSMDLGEDLDHGDCSLPAFLATLNFFNTFLQPSFVSTSSNLKQIRLFPNPVQDRLFIEDERLISGTTIIISDFHGKVIRRTSYSLSGISVSALKSGIYSLSYLQGGELQHGTFIVQK